MGMAGRLRPATLDGEPGPRPGERQEKNEVMSESVSLGSVGAAARDRTRTLFGQTMWYVVGFVCLIAMNFTVRRSQALTVGLLLAFGTALGLAMAPTLVYYASTNPQALWQAGGATALFIAGFGAAGYATRRDLSGLARLCFWALIALIVFGIVLIFVRIPAGDLIYSILGLVIFAGLTMFDFHRLRRSKDINSAPLLAASIFLDALNVFLFFLRIFSRGSN